MAFNLLDAARNLLTEQVINRLADYLGEPESNTQTALDGALPTVLGGLIQRVNQPGGAADVLGELRQYPPAASGGLLQSLEALFTGDATRPTAFGGSDLLGTLFGGRLNGVAEALAAHANVKTTSATTLLGVAGTALMSALSGHSAGVPSNPSGLAMLLDEQRDAVTAALPAGLITLLSRVPGFELFAGGTTRPVTPLGEARSTTDAPRVAPAGTTVAYGESRPERRKMNWLPWVLALLGIILLIYLLRNCGDRRETVGAAADTLRTEANETGDRLAAEADTVATDVRAAADTVGERLENAADRLGAFFKRNLPTGFELNIPERGVENKLVQYIESDRVVDKETWFDFDRLLFDTNEATLKPSSQEQLKNVAEILRAYPNVNIKIGGYTDNVGDPKANQNLSERRASSVVGELKRLGVAASRLESEGYGEQHPVASNDTEAGRAQNRRISIRVTKK